ncbi:MAG: PAS domain-containing protein [Methylococcaceae bacterium]
MQTFIDFLGIKDFIPHGYCLNWSPLLLWLHVISDAVISLSYYLIPLIIFSFTRRRKDNPYSPLFLMFGAFIVACGTTHLLSILTIWIPLYWLDGWLKALTAAISLITAIVMFRVVPEALQLPDTVEQLRIEIRKREEAQQAEHLAITALQESEERLRLVLEGAELGFWDWNIVTGKVERNAVSAKILGYNFEEMPYTIQQWTCFIHPADKEKVWQSINDILNGCSLESKIEYRMLHKDGGIRWIFDQGKVMERDANGKPIRMSGIHCDITDRKQAEQSLRESQSDLNRAQAVAHIGCWRIDILANVLKWSDEVFRIFGVTPNTPLSYQSFLDIVHPADREFVDVSWKNALTGKPYDIEHRIIVDQKIKWVRELAELEFDEQGALLGAFGTVEDITDLKSSQEILQHERAFLRQIIDAAPNMIFVKDREGRFLLCNEALALCYGASPESLIGLTDGDFNSNTDEVTQLNRDDIDVINSCKPKRIPEEKITHADGSVHWYSTVKIPLIDYDNSCNKLLGVASDISERKRAEEVLRLMDRRKDEFLAMLAHELRNPLAPIRNAIQLLKMQTASDPRLTWSLSIIDRQVTHMAQLLDDLLDVARIMQNKITLKIEPFELADIINNAVETSKPLIDSRGQELIVSQTTAPLWLEGDRVRLEQVLSNLLNNAAKYTSEGGKITLTVLREGLDIVIEVRDTGIGISPDILPGIFELFAQADNSLAHSQGGLGIGLTLVRQLVESHGGTVSAESAGIGQGCSFTVRLPALPMEFSAAEPVLIEATAPMPKLRILVVDDYVDVVESMKMLLQLDGHEIETADCGMKALELAQTFCPQVVLLDIGLPDLDGYEVAKRLRMLPETRDALLIALTGYGQPEDREHSQSVGFNHHLLKPIDFETLFALLRPPSNRPAQI